MGLLKREGLTIDRLNVLSGIPRSTLYGALKTGRANSHTIQRLERDVDRIGVRDFPNENTLPGYEAGVELIAGSPRRGEVAAMFSMNRVHVLDVVRRRWRKHVEVRCASPRRIAWSPGGEVLAIASENGGVWLCDIATGELRGVPVHNSQYTNGMAWSPDGAPLACGGDYGVDLWDVTRKMIRRLGRLTGVNCLAWSPDGRYLTAGARNTECGRGTFKTAVI